MNQHQCDHITPNPGKNPRNTSRHTPYFFDYKAAFYSPIKDLVFAAMSTCEADKAMQNDVEQFLQLIYKIWLEKSMPNDWNLSVLCPVLKKGEPTDAPTTGV